ncbi:MAG: hypothetical protein Phyf2KO_05830 [Phycisphaerales bacterium]
MNYNKDRRNDRPKPTGKGGKPKPGFHKPRGDGKRAPYGARRERLPRELDIVHEDADILVVNKPSGIVSAMPKPGGRPTLYDMVKDYARAKGGRAARAFVVHRLDLDASGLLIFAKHKAALDWLKDDLRARRIDRLYVALVEGTFEAGVGTTGTAQSFLKEEQAGHVVSVPDRLFRGSKGDNKDARPAVTHYRVLGQAGSHALVQLKLETGRKHQIRVHMADMGHPLVGDQRYGSGPSQLKRLALHASELAFRHPGTGQRVRFSCPAPSSFYEAVEMTLPKTSRPAPDEIKASDRRIKADKFSSLNKDPEAGWDEVSDWYGDYQTSGKSDHFSEVIIPGAVGMLAVNQGERVLDIACGEGRMAAALTDLGAKVSGVDASPTLIQAAQARKLPHSHFVVGDARQLGSLPSEITGEPYDAAACIMALMNINPISDLLESASNLLKPGGRFVAVILHPSFRAPGQTSWGWEGNKSHEQKQYRRVDAYLSSKAEPIVMNPGEVASGGEAIKTFTHHRPLESYIKAFAKAGLYIDDLEEWPSRRKSEPGPRADEENRSRREIPLFMAIRATKLGDQS